MKVQVTILDLMQTHPTIEFTANWFVLNSSIASAGENTISKALCRLEKQGKVRLARMVGRKKAYVFGPKIEATPAQAEQEIIGEAQG